MKTLIESARDGHEKEVISFLKNASADLHEQDGVYGTALTAAMWQGHKNIVLLLLAEEKSFSHAKHPGAFLYAVRYDWDDVVERLIDLGADFNSSGGEYRKEPDNWTEILEKNVLSPFISKEGLVFDLPLVIAMRDDKCEALKVLLEAGADLDKRNALGVSGNDLLLDDEVSESVLQIVKEKTCRYQLSK